MDILINQIQSTSLFKKIVWLFLCLILGCKLFSQNSPNPRSSKLIGYNIGLNALVGGLGKAINRDKEEKFIDAFLKGAVGGSIGGSLIYFSKSRNQILNNPNRSAWANRLIYFTGYSIVNNVSQNKKPWDAFHFQLYGVEAKISYKDSLITNFRVSLATVCSFVIMAADGHAFSINKSLKYGVYYFDYNVPQSQNLSSPFYYGQVAGFALSNAIAIDEYAVKGIYNPQRPFFPVYPPAPYLIPHELIHTYQYLDYLPMRNFLKPAFKKKYPITKYIAFDISPMPLFYLLGRIKDPFNNFYEYEADRFSE